MAHLSSGGALRSLRYGQYETAAAKLTPHYVEKPWGRTELPAMFAAANGKRIGEIWFTSDEVLPLLAKYLFTSDTLSVQVHPNDEQARQRGLASGKAECWYVIDAEPAATIGLGLTAALGKEALRDAALDGSIERLIDWRPVKAGDFYYVPPGTVHAIGGGISLLEFQQNSDSTYRLYDYGRPRALHVDDALAVAVPGRYPDQFHRSVASIDDCVLVDGPHFTLVHTRSDALQQRRRWVLPLEGLAACRGEIALPGECLLVDAQVPLDEAGGRMLIGAATA